MNNLAILITVFNHTNNLYFNSNWNKFIDGIKSLAADTYICEIIPKNHDPIARLDGSNHYTVYTDSNVWHKETGINYLLKKIPDRYKYVMVLDNDIVFHKNNWYKNSINLLESHIMIQAFDLVSYLEQNGTDIEKQDYSMIRCATGMPLIYNGNPGMAVAYHRDYLDHMNGLFDQAIVGGGDLLNIIPFFYNTHAISPKIFDMLCSDSREEYFIYLLRAKDFIQNKRIGITYLDNSHISHLFHGYIKHRQYYSRYQIINNYKLQNISYRDTNNFITIQDPAVIKKIQIFFDIRQSLDCIDKPIIMTNSKYGVDGDNSLLLAPQDQISFRNINRAYIEIKQHHTLNNLQITINGDIINIDALEKNKQIEFDIHEPYNIELSSDTPPSIPNDIRSLGLLVSNIKIFNEHTKEMEDFPLSDVM